MIFPLGLGHRFFRFPLASLALIGLLFAIHFKTSDWRAQYNKELNTAKAKEQLTQVYQRHQLLSSSSVSLRSVLQSPFVQRGFAPLILNCIIILILGAFIELRMGSRRFLISYLAAAWIGNWLEAVVIIKSDYVVGASAGSAAVIGLFFILFFHHKLKCLFYDFTEVRKIYLPVKFSLPAMYLTGSLFGFAHFATYIALSIGAGIAIWFLFKRPVSKPFVYPQDEALWKDVSSHLPETRLLLISANSILRRNPHNLKLRAETFDVLLCRHHEGEYSREMARFFEDNLHLYVEGLEENGYSEEVFSLLAMIPKNLAFNGAYKWLSQKTLLHYGGLSFGKGQFALAILLFLQFIETYPKSKKIPDVLRTVQALAVKLTEEEKNELLPLVKLARFPVVLNWLDQFLNEAPPDIKAA